MIAIIDYGAGNLQSVLNAFEYLNCDIKIVSTKKDLLNANGAVLPGVGSFGEAMQCLEKSDLNGAICEYIATGKPLLGICLGLQLLFEGSEESPNVKGLGILNGIIKKIPDGNNLKIPHIGWNSIDFSKTSKLFEGIEQKSFVYFVHSYYLNSNDQRIVSAKTNYGVKIDCAVEYKNIYATQFHPEKSGIVGIEILKNYIKIIKGD